MELLAPAGCLETAAAAFQYGADAVYCGLHQFSARADAVNFSSEELSVLLGLAHQDSRRPRKVYLTLNTLLRQSELQQLLRILAQLEEMPPDGLIVQDLAVARLVRRHFPTLALHASTQLAIHSLDGLRACRELGFSRVIAARELTLNEVSAMAAEPGIELEVFVHGALCYAYSGLCLLSSVLRDASGNRGECAYLCRTAWDVSDGRRWLSRGCPAMSMKDLGQPDALGALARAGVASVKIEGRKKSPLYVAAVTNYYRKALDNDFRPGERESCEQDIRAIFSRPWTRLFLPGSRRFDVTDVSVTGPRGCPAGRVLAFIPAGAGRPPRLRLVTSGITLERHDGLQVELPGRLRPYGFPVDAISRFQQGGGGRRESVFSVPPESTVEIPLPEDAPEIHAGTPLFCTSSQQTQRRYQWPSVRATLQRQRQPVEISVAVEAERIAGEIAVGGGGGTIRATGAVAAPAGGFAVARSGQAENEASIRACLEKLGDTPYRAAAVTVVNPQGLFVPASALNQLRRQLAADLLAAQSRARQEKVEGIAAAMDAAAPAVAEAAAALASASPQWRVKIDRSFLLNLVPEDRLGQLSGVIFDLSRSRPDEDIPGMLAPLAARLGGWARLHIALPAILRDGDAGGAGRPREWRPVLAALAAAGCRNWQVASLGALQLLREEGLFAAADSVTGDWPLYCHNSEAAGMLLEELGLRQVTLSPDDALDNWRALLATLGDRCEVPVLQDTPLAISAVCFNASMRGGCPGPGNCTFKEYQLSDRNGERLIACNNHCQSVFIRQEPLDRSAEMERLRRYGARCFRADFIWRDWTPAQVRDRLEALLEE